MAGPAFSNVYDHARKIARPDPSTERGIYGALQIRSNRTDDLRQPGFDVMTAVLFVCMGNICRSPMASAVAKAVAKKALREPEADGRPRRIDFDSAGTHAHHVGEKTDSRANASLLRHKYSASEHRSRRIAPRDFERFDLILAMDRSNLSELRRRCPRELAWKLHLLLDFAPGLAGQEVPDPYYGSVHGFERVLELCVAGATGLIAAYQSGELGSGVDASALLAAAGAD